MTMPFRISCLAILLATLATSAIGRAQDVHGESILKNGSFEKMSNYRPWNKTKAETGNLKVENDSCPTGWFYFNETPMDQQASGPTITFGRDESVKHDGHASIFIEQSQTTDIGTLGADPFPIQPSTKYTIRVWIKGDDIVRDSQRGTSPGICVWTKDGPAVNFWASEGRIHLPEGMEGTFDWQKYEFTIESKPDSEKMLVIFQLRRGSGKVWFADAEVIPAKR